VETRILSLRPPEIPETKLDVTRIFRFKLLAGSFKMSVNDLLEQGYCTADDLADIAAAIRQEIPYLTTTKKEKEMGLALNDQVRQLLHDYATDHPGEVSMAAIANLLEVPLGVISRSLIESGFNLEAWNAERRKLIDECEIVIPGSSWPVTRVFHAQILRGAYGMPGELVAERFFTKLPREEVLFHAGLRLPFGRRFRHPPAKRPYPMLTAFEQKMLEQYLRKYQGKISFKAIGRFFSLDPDVPKRLATELGLDLEQWQANWKEVEATRRQPAAASIPGSALTVPQVIHLQLCAFEFNLDANELHALAVIPEQTPEEIDTHLKLNLAMIGIDPTSTEPVLKVNQRRRMMLQDYLTAFPGKIGLNAIARFFHIGEPTLEAEMNSMGINVAEWKEKWKVERTTTWIKTLDKLGAEPLSAIQLYHLQILAKEYGFDAARIVRLKVVTGLEEEAIQNILRRHLAYPIRKECTGELRHYSALRHIEYVLVEQYLLAYQGKVSHEAISRFFHLSEISLLTMTREAGIDYGQWKKTRWADPERISPIAKIRISGAKWPVEDVLHIQLLALERTHRRGTLRKEGLCGSVAR